MADALSETDILILEEIQQDSSRSTAELAEKVRLSQSPCWRRLQRLKEEGYIAREVGLIDRSRFGANIVIFAEVSFGEMTEDMRSELHRKIASVPQIVECYSVFGDTDMIMKVFAESLGWYQGFYFNILRKLPGVTDVRSSVTLAEIKYTTAIPVRPTTPPPVS